jgi:hypothetical protein
MVELDPDGVIVNAHQILDVARHLRGVELVRLALAVLAQHVERVDDVIRTERCAIVPTDALAQMHGDLRIVVSVFVAFGEPGDHFVIEHTIVEQRLQNEGDTGSQV